VNDSPEKGSLPRCHNRRIRSQEEIQPQKQASPPDEIKNKYRIERGEKASLPK
jgi:hypothetical protein